MSSENKDWSEDGCWLNYASQTWGEPYPVGVLLNKIDRKIRIGCGLFHDMDKRDLEFLERAIHNHYRLMLVGELFLEYAKRSGLDKTDEWLANEVIGKVGAILSNAKWGNFRPDDQIDKIFEQFDNSEYRNKRAFATYVPENKEDIEAKLKSNQ